ncbi:MAG: hypothetical protein QM658_10695, partial [Gordonia sp. (in: high G+C Gram-positive bacteria)]
HSTGYCGCPIGVDPVWKYYPLRPDGLGTGHASLTGRNGGTLTAAELCIRWDADQWTHCVCGHPWGVHVHTYGYSPPNPAAPFACGTYCGCRDYQEASA